MSLFLAEYRLPLPDDKGGFMTTTVKFEAETLQLAQREVERVIGNSNMEDAVLYQAVSTTKVQRTVASVSVNGQKVVIGSAHVPQVSQEGQA